MASKDDKAKDKDKAKPKAPPKPDAKAEAKAKPKEKDKEKAKEKDAAAAAPKEEKPKPAPRPPADPRLKFVKKFHGKFLPKGPLRDRHKALMTRWNSGEDHAGVTVDELKSLYNDWKASKQKPARKPASV